jgi:hypothetical protein
VDILAEAAGRLLAGPQTTVTAATQQTSPPNQGDDAPADDWAVRRRRPTVMADAPRQFFLRV